MQPDYPLPYEATFAHRVVSTDGQDTLDIWELTPRGSAQAWDDFPRKCSRPWYSLSPSFRRRKRRAFGRG